MIKINLATRKKAAAVASPEPGGAMSTTKLNLSGDWAKHPVIRRLIILIAVAYGADFLMQSDLEEKALLMDKKLQKLKAEQTKALAELQGAGSYSELKKSLESDEQLLKTKLEVIKKLMNQQTQPSKFLIALSGVIPREVWLEDYSTEVEQIKMNGHATSFDKVSDFMQALTESAYYRDVNLASSEQTKDESGEDIIKFSLSAKGRDQ